MTWYVCERNGWESHRREDMSGNVLFVATDGTKHEVPGEIVLATVASFIERLLVERDMAESEEETSMKLNIRIVHPTQGKTVVVSAGMLPLAGHTIEIEGKCYEVKDVLHELNGDKLNAWVNVWPL